MNDPKERTAWIKAQEAAADEDPHGYPEPGEPNESTEERMQRFFFQQMAEGNATANGDGAQLLTVTITLAEYRRLAQQDGKLEYLQEQLDKKEEALTFMHQKSIEDDKAASNYRRQIEDLNRDRRNLAENANIVANAEQKTRESLERANARIEELTQDIIRVEGQTLASKNSRRTLSGSRRTETQPGNGSARFPSSWTPQKHVSKIKPSP